MLQLLRLIFVSAQHLPNETLSLGLVVQESWNSNFNEPNQIQLYFGRPKLLRSTELI